MMLRLAAPPLVAQEAPDAKDQQADVEPAPLGSINNPIKCDDPGGEHYYLYRLVDPKGRSIDYSRVGSVGGPKGGILDLYKVKVGDDILDIYMDMYHHGYYEEQPVPGFYLRCRMSRDLVIREDGWRYTFDGKQPYDGKYITKDEDTGETLAEVTVRKGLLQGAAIRYHDNGQVDQRVPFEDGVEHGTARYYDENEKLKVTIDYKQGKRHGESTWFRPDGTIEALYTYEHGKTHGRHFNTHEDGSIQRKGQFKEGQAQGVFTYYDPQGNITKHEHYREGKIVEDAEDEARGQG